MYKVSHKNSEESRAQSATLGYPTQDVNTAAFWDPWVEDTNLDYMKSFPEMFPHSPYNIFLAQ